MFTGRSNDPIVTPISDATAIVTTDARMPPGRREYRGAHVRRLLTVTSGRGAARTGTWGSDTGDIQFREHFYS